MHMSQQKKKKTFYRNLYSFLTFICSSIVRTTHISMTTALVHTQNENYIYTIF